MTNRILALLALLLAPLLTACSSSPDKQIQYYHLGQSAQPPAGLLLVDRPVIRVMPVRLAAPLEQRNLHIQLAPHRLHSANWHQWGSEPSEMLTRRFAAELTGQKPGLWIQDGSQHWPSGDPVRRLVIDVERLQGDEKGQALFSGQWRLYGPDYDLLAGARFDARAPLGAEGYPALVETLDGLIRREAATLAAGLPDQ